MTNNFDATPRQVEANQLLASAAPHILLYGGSRSGKTFIILRAVLMRALRAPNSRHCILRFRFNHLMASIVHDTYPKVIEACFDGLRPQMNRSAWFSQLPNGSQIWFGGLDDKERTEKILGQEYSTIFLNECSQITYEARNIALTRLAQSVSDEDGVRLPLRMLYDCNPPTRGHWSYKLFFSHLDPVTDKRIPGATGRFAAMQLNPADNESNLPAEYLQTLHELPARLRRRFLEGEYGDDRPNALWTDDIIERWRVIDGNVPDYQRIVIGVDPSGASDADAADHDEIGIVVAALGTDGRGYLLEDITVRGGPATWGKAVTAAYERHDADLVVGEVNYGGAMVEHVIRTARPNTPFKSVTASRGKVVRAEPISSLYEQGKIRHVGFFRTLEDELCAFTTFGYTGERSPNRADAAIWAFAELFPGLTKVEKVVKKSPKRIPVATEGGWMGA